MFEIPKRFEIISQEIEVEFVDDLVLYQQSLGQARFNENKIIIQKSTPSYPIADGQLKHTFCHEVVHKWFNAMGETELCANEQLVDVMGNLLLQFLNTKEEE